MSASDDERLPPGSFSLRHGFPTWFGVTERSSDTSPIVDIAEKKSEEVVGATLIDPMGLSQEFRRPTIVEVLDYVKCSFDQDDFLDDVPLDAAGNSGAWKAWKAYRASNNVGTAGSSASKAPSDMQDEWKWDGVWEQRVRRGIDTSVSDAVLFGSANVDELVCVPFPATCNALIMVCSLAFLTSVKKFRMRSVITWYLKREIQLRLLISVYN